MNRIKVVASKIKSIKLSQIIASCLLATMLVLATTSSNFALAASNKSNTTYPTDDGNLEGVQYSDENNVESLDNVDDFVTPTEQAKLLDPSQIPAKKQPILDRSDPDANLLEKTKQMFDDAADFSGN